MNPGDLAAVEPRIGWPLCRRRVIARANATHCCCWPATGCRSGEDSFSEIRPGRFSGAGHVKDPPLRPIAARGEMPCDGDDSIRDVECARRIATLIGDNANLVTIACEAQH